MPVWNSCLCLLFCFSDGQIWSILKLSGNALKVIAIIAMTVDHLAWMGIAEYSQVETAIQIFLHCIGRLTAPIMNSLMLRVLSGL